MSHESAEENVKNVLQPYEVFVRRAKPGAVYEHVGSVLAPSPKLAVDYGHEIFARRIVIKGIWVVPRSAIFSATGADEAAHAISSRRPYRQPSFFTGQSMLERNENVVAS